MPRHGGRDARGPGAVTGMTIAGMPDGIDFQEL
jgi:hypothetical protein